MTDQLRCKTHQLFVEFDYEGSRTIYQCSKCPYKETWDWNNNQTEIVT